VERSVQAQETPSRRESTIRHLSLVASTPEITVQNDPENEAFIETFLSRSPTPASVAFIFRTLHLFPNAA
jgi:hypothetical protein